MNSSCGEEGSKAKDGNNKKGQHTNQNAKSGDHPSSTGIRASCSRKQNYPTSDDGRGSKNLQTQRNIRGKRASKNSTFKSTKSAGMVQKHKINRKSPPIEVGLKGLQNLLKMDPKEVQLQIYCNLEMWKEFLVPEKLSVEAQLLVIELIGEKLCADTELSHLQTILVKKICSKKVISMIKCIVTNVDLTTAYCNPVTAKMTKNVYALCNFVVNMMSFNEAEHFKELISKSLRVSSVVDPDMGSLVEFKFFSNQDRIENDKSSDCESPPNDFRDVETIPTIEELRQENFKPYLRPNKPSGGYNDTDHYLDVQFRLLREDFVQPLRKGVQRFLKNTHAYISGKKKMPLGEGRLYNYVRIVGAKRDGDTLVYQLKLRGAEYKSVKWEKSKWLLTGSLILLTTIKKTFQPEFTHVGVVCTRKRLELARGIVSVSWEGDPPKYQEEEYLMLESEVYMEAYRHTLNTLKTIKLKSFPMKKFIVDANSIIGSPKYLNNATDPIKLRLVDRSEVQVSQDFVSWPSASSFGFDENQFQAYQAAVAKEFSIIQGPPGTGKTFLGLKVCETLLDNSKLWKKNSGGPITVVCYTNHALDQFLEGILRYFEREEKYPDMIRIGGRCGSEVLTNFTLKEVRNRLRKKDCLPKIPGNAVILETIENLEFERALKMSEINCLQNPQGIIDYEKLSVWNTLRHEFPKILWKYLRNVAWLGIDNRKLDFFLFSENRVVNQMFNVKKPLKSSQKPNKAFRIPELAGKGTTEDVTGCEEECDVEELLANRVVDEDEESPNLDEIFLEAGGRPRRNGSGGCKYISGFSVTDCENLMVKLKRGIDVASEEQRLQNSKPVATDSQIRKKPVEPNWLGEDIAQTPQKALIVLQNRRNILAEIFRLHKQHCLDLPDIKNLLEDIKNSTESIRLSKLRNDECWALYFAVAERAKILTAEKVHALEKRLSDSQKVIKNIREIRDSMIVRNCKIVGLTTTGAAKYNNLLRMIRSKIVIVEEAAEVFEAHIVTSISKYCEQLILIGDHRQLRPSPAVYGLGKRYNLDLSFFERMLNNRIHCYQLKVQHRMQPDISNLVRDTIYKELDDHESVKMYPEVSGIVKSVFFVTHMEQEKESNMTSKSNEHEANFVASLCRHLLLQGYQPDRITILAMYTGQVSLLKKTVQSVAVGMQIVGEVRITSVDNFQGEENDIILLSLVRSNDEEKIGFLGIDNRICVSLSRARHGLYIIGNMGLLENKSDTWKQIKDKLEENGQIGESLELKCEIHKTISTVQFGEGFIKASPEGGCQEMCNTTLECSHICPRFCHVLDKDHSEHKCKEKCMRKCSNNLHPCTGLCYQECLTCLEQVERILPCMHKAEMMCYQNAEDAICNVTVEKTLPCEHIESLPCSIDVYVHKCMVPVKKTLSCGHKETLDCHVDPQSIKCETKTLKFLPCGHFQIAECFKEPEVLECDIMVTKALSKCGHNATFKCSQKEETIICKSQCNMPLACGHQCTKSCHTQDDPDHLQYKCKNECRRHCKNEHKCRFIHKCYMPCPPCKLWTLKTLSCGHKKKLLCSTNLEKFKCMQKCMKKFPCGHSCPNTCSQPCGTCPKLVKKNAPCGHVQFLECGKPALKENCEKLVKIKAVPSCGHKSLVPCKADGASADDLVKYCRKPCNRSHDADISKVKCVKKCGECFLHMKNQPKCNKVLICGHMCDASTSVVCPPCPKLCFKKCEHSICMKNCGDLCSPCMEKCTWVCPHDRCTKTCGELCDRKPCDHPCPKKLKCSHDCIGFCGEPCPPLCRICDEEELANIVHILSFKRLEDCQFIYLADCGHTVEAEALETHINFSSRTGIFQGITCPIGCSTPIRNCRRYHNAIVRFLNDLVNVTRLCKCKK